MFGISFLELLVIFGVALIVLGPEKIPEVASFLGKWTGELKRMSDGVRREFYNSVYTPMEEPTKREEAPRALKVAREDEQRADQAESKALSEEPAPTTEEPAPQETEDKGVSKDEADAGVAK